MIGTSIEAAVSLLKGGDVVAFPTETVYGLGAIAFDAHAVAKIFERKGRPHFDPLIVHAASMADAFRLCECVPETARLLAERFWPGPLTLVMRKIQAIPDLVTSGLPSVGVRVPAHPVAHALLEALEAPLAAPSANRFGKVSPTTAEHVLQDLGSSIPMILDGGPCQRGIESTIVSLLESTPRLLRPGSIALEELRDVVGNVTLPSSNTEISLSPGQLKSHYAPRTPMQPATEAPRPRPGERVGLLAIGPTADDGYSAVEVLSATADLREAATRLFAALRRLDSLRLDRIVCELAPVRGLGTAINDRLLRGCQASTIDG
jgi:L-threonylcarbamoyladenylate synthase